MTLIELARKLRGLIEKAAQSLDEADALEAVELYPAWESGKEYVAGMRVRDNGVLYSVLQNHTSQSDWKPENAPSLFARVLIPDENEVPEWVQPDSTNPYMTGDTVTHNGQTWRSKIDNNVWEPGATGTETLWESI